MNIRAFESRLHMLKAALKELENEKEGADDALEIRRLDDKLIEMGGHIKEVQQWLDAYDDDPGWGQYFKQLDGQRVPKLPTFSSLEEREARMASPSGNRPGAWTEEEVRGAREFRAMEDARESAVWLDGKSPYAGLDEHTSS
jgi:hypothetical protein